MGADKAPRRSLLDEAAVCGLIGSNRASRQHRAKQYRKSNSGSARISIARLVIDAAVNSAPIPNRSRIESDVVHDCNSSSKQTKPITISEATASQYQMSGFMTIPPLAETALVAKCGRRIYHRGAPHPMPSRPNHLSRHRLSRPCEDWRRGI